MDSIFVAISYTFEPPTVFDFVNRDFKTTEEQSFHVGVPRIRPILTP